VFAMSLLNESNDIMSC